MGNENTETQAMNEYLIQVLTGKVKVAGLEATVVLRMQEDEAESRQLDSVIAQLSQKLESAKLRMLNLQGRREAYIQLLADEEIARRKKAEPAPQSKGVSLSIEDREILSSALGAPISKAEIFPVRPSRPSAQPSV